MSEVERQLPTAMVAYMPKPRTDWVKTEAVVLDAITWWSRTLAKRGNAHGDDVEFAQARHLYEPLTSLVESADYIHFVENHPRTFAALPQQVVQAFAQDAIRSFNGDPYARLDLIRALWQGCGYDRTGKPGCRKPNKVALNALLKPIELHSAYFLGAHLNKAGIGKLYFCHLATFGYSQAIDGVGMRWLRASSGGMDIGMFYTDYLQPWINTRTGRPKIGWREQTLLPNDWYQPFYERDAAGFISFLLSFERKPACIPVKAILEECYTSHRQSYIAAAQQLRSNPKIQAGVKRLHSTSLISTDRKAEMPSYLKPFALQSS